jgi:hypothetical protein
LRFLLGRGLTETISPGPRENPLRDDRSGGPLIDPAYFMNFGSVVFRFFMLSELRHKVSYHKNTGQVGKSSIIESGFSPLYSGFSVVVQAF